MLVKDVLQRSDIEDIVTRFYDVMLKDPIVGFIFTNVANIIGGMMSWNGKVSYPKAA